MERTGAEMPQSEYPTAEDAALADQLARETYGEHHPSVDPALFEAWQTRNDEAAGLELIRRYGAFAHKVAIFYAQHLPARASAIDGEDLAQEALLSLLYRAGRSFDPSRGYSFLTHAMKIVRGDVWRHIENMRSTIRLPVHVQEKLGKINQADRKRQEQGLPPLSDAEAAQLVNVHEEGGAFAEKPNAPLNIAALRVAQAIISRPFSINADLPGPNLKTPGDPMTLPFAQENIFPHTAQTAEPPSDPEEEVIKKIECAAVRHALDTNFAPVEPAVDKKTGEVTEKEQGKADRLTKQRRRMREILERRHGFGDADEETLRRIGGRLGITGEAARQIYIKAEWAVEQSLREQGFNGE